MRSLGDAGRMLSVTDRARGELPGVVVGALRLVCPEPRDGALPEPGEVVEARELALLPEDPVVRAYRDLSWKLGIDPTKQRPAGEALFRRVAAGKGLPAIGPLVDAYNLASAATLVPLSAFDATALGGDLRLDLAGQREAFTPLFKEEMIVEPGRVVWRDDEGIVALFLYRDGERTAIRDETSEAVVVATLAPGVGIALLPEAFERVERFAGAFGWRASGLPSMVRV